AGTEVVAGVERPEDKLLAAGVKVDIKVQPGDKYVAKDEELIVTATVTPIGKEGVRPEFCNLVMNYSDGSTSRHKMEGDRKGEAYTYKIDKVPGDFRYRIEAEKDVSNTYKVTAIDPPGLEYTKLTFVPPAYARNILSGQTWYQFPDSATMVVHDRLPWNCGFYPALDVKELEYTTVRCEFHF